MRRGSIFSRFFQDLGNGDPVALVVLAGFLVFLGIVGIVAWRFQTEERREKERKDRK